MVRKGWESLYLFLWATLSSYCKLGSFKEAIYFAKFFILSQFCRRDVWSQCSGRAIIPLKTRQTPSCLLQLLLVLGVPWTTAARNCCSASILQGPSKSRVISSQNPSLLVAKLCPHLSPQFTCWSPNLQNLRTWLHLQIRPLKRQ